MTNIPLTKKLKKSDHLQVALAQDLLVSELYEHYPKAVIHGGTAIWRCYNGNRFSEDIDAYINSLEEDKINNFSDGLVQRGFKKTKMKVTENAVFSKFSRQGAIVRFEAVEKELDDYSTKRFEMTDGSSIVVNTLPPAQLIKEKVNAYLGRRKIRDLYDIFFLIEYVEDKEKIGEDLSKLLNNFKAPEDEADLKTVIITGAVPKEKDMISEIKKWAK